MTEYIIALIKEINAIPNLWIYLLGVMICISLFKAVLKDRSIKYVVFDVLIYATFFIVVLLVVGNILITKKYPAMWEIIAAITFFGLQKYFPVFLKWYDDRVDDIIEPKQK